MDKFSDFNIKPLTEQLLGRKINIDDVFNNEIIIEKFKIVDSKYEKGTKKCLHIQFTMKGIQHVLFSGSGILMSLITQVPVERFPFTTTIVKDNKCHVFK